MIHGQKNERGEERIIKKNLLKLVKFFLFFILIPGILVN